MLEFHRCLVLVGVLHMVMHELVVFEVHVKGGFISRAIPRVLHGVQ